MCCYIQFTEYVRTKIQGNPFIRNLILDLPWKLIVFKKFWSKFLTFRFSKYNYKSALFVSWPWIVFFCCRNSVIFIRITKFLNLSTYLHRYSTSLIYHTIDKPVKFWSKKSYEAVIVSVLISFVQIVVRRLLELNISWEKKQYHIMNLSCAII